MAQNVRGSGLQLRRCRLHLTLLAFTPLFFVLTFFRIQFCAIYSIHNRPQVISRSPGRLPSLESHLRPSLHQDYQLEVNLVFFFFGLHRWAMPADVELDRCIVAL